jgi:hypothetical protein
VVEHRGARNKINTGRSKKEKKKENIAIMCSEFPPPVRPEFTRGV